MRARAHAFVTALVVRELFLVKVEDLHVAGQQRIRRAGAIEAECGNANGVFQRVTDM